MSDSFATMRDRLVRVVDDVADEIVAFTADLIRIPTINPPGEHYEACARLIGEKLEGFEFDVEYAVADDRPEHSTAYPRVNVVGRRQGAAARPAVHLNGHVDVVPVGDGWTRDPFGGDVVDGRIYGRGACDMKAGIAAALFAAEAFRRADIPLAGTIELSATVDEESGGWAGVAHLARRGRISHRDLDYVIIPEPLNVDRICVGHRGVYWFEVTTHGHIAHGSMPFLGVSAIEHMGEVLHAVRDELLPALARRTTAMPVVPDGARHATLNVNALTGGQAGSPIQSPCVAHECVATFDRRFLKEEGFEAAKAEIETLLARVAARVPHMRYDLRDLMVVHPVETPPRSPLTATLETAIRDILGRDAALVASPGTYDHKHVARIGGIEHCVAYGPGILELAHQPDEWCGVDDLVDATKVLALALFDLVGMPRRP
ncbi:MAG: acetylornithine deacetylase/succinyl-diaminopimelate desuccinylase family protein [Vicinamibacterales bacterium]